MEYTKKVLANPKKYLDETNPILVLPGLQAKCEQMTMVVNNLKKSSLYYWFRIARVQCLQYTSGIFTNLEKAAEEACKLAEDVVSKLNLGFGDKITLLGISQGGIVARYLL